MSLVGSLEDLGLGDILQIVSLSRKSGVLNLSWGEVKGKILFKDGQVVAATVSDEKPCLAKMLEQRGALPSDKTEAAENAVKQGSKAGQVVEVLAKEFGVPHDKIEEAVRDEIESAVFKFFTWPEGNFSFELQEIDSEIEGLDHPYHAFVLEVGLSPQFLAMEGTRLQDERKRDRAEAPVGPPRASEAAAGPRPAETREPPSPQSEAAGFDEETDFGSVADAVAYYESKAGEGETGRQKETREERVPRPEPPPRPGAEEAAALEQAGPVRRVVVVDDDPALLDSLAYHLGRQGYKVDAFSRIDTALSRVRELSEIGTRPVAVLADLIMPDSKGVSTLGGLDVLEKTKSIDPALSVYVMSDYENRPAREKAEGAGARFFFMKPKSSQLDDYESPELVNFVQVLRSALDSEKREAPAEAPRQEEGLINLGEELRKEFGEEVRPPSETEQVVPSPGLHMLKTMINELNDPASNGQITLMILRFAAELMNRAVIFLVARNTLAGLGQFGISIDGEDPHKHVRQMRIPLNEPSIFREAIQKRLPLKKALKKNKWNQYLIEHLGGEAPFEVFVAPIIAGGKIPAILYGDNAPEKRGIGDTESLEIFLAQAGLAMEKALLERKLKESGRQEDTE